MLNLEMFWDADADVQPPAKATDIKRCEKRIGYTLPPQLVAALKIQDGGYVQNEDIVLFQSNSRDPTDAINRLDKYLAGDPEALETLEDDFADPRKLVAFAATDDGSTVFALNYSSTTPVGEPTVAWLDLDRFACGDSELTFSEFFAEMLRTDEEPTVDWSEVEQMKSVAEVRSEDNDDAYYLNDQRIYDTGASVVVFRRLIEQGLETLVRCEIMKPLSADQCVIVPVPDDELGFTYELTLAPEVEEMESAPGEELQDAYETFNIQMNESRQVGDGRWRNLEHSNEVQSFPFTSDDREMLVRVRETLLGGREISERAEAHERWVEKLASMDEESLENAFPHLMSRMFDKAESMLEDLPPEQRDAVSEFNQLKEMLSKSSPPSGKSKGKKKGNPKTSEIDPELMELTERMLELDNPFKNE